MGTLRLDRVPPQNIDAERAVLGALLTPDENRVALAKVVNVLSAKDFYRQAHQRIYDAITTLFASNQNVDLLTVTEQLTKNGDLESVGGVAYLDGMIDSVPTASNADYYARFVKQAAHRRSIASQVAKTYNDVFDDTVETDALLGDLENTILSVRRNDNSNAGLVSVKDLMAPAFNRLDEVYKNKRHLLGLSTGFIDLDDLILGLEPSNLILIAGRPSMGKSMLAQNIAECVGVDQGKYVAFFSLEMSKELLVLRMLASQSGASLHAMRTGNMGESMWPKLTIAAGKIVEGGGRIFIDDTSAITPRHIRGQLSELQLQREISLVVVDYLQIMKAENVKQEKVDRISDISRDLKGIAKDFHVPVIALSQLSRKNEHGQSGDKRPDLSCLRDSGALEQDADTVMFVYREHYYNKTYDATDAEIIVGKQRNGPTDTVHLNYRPAYMRFENRAKGNNAG